MNQRIFLSKPMYLHISPINPIVNSCVTFFFGFSGGSGGGGVRQRISTVMPQKFHYFRY